VGSAPARRETPLTFGRYEALFHIASGGMAEVFAARLRGPAGFEKLVAVKRLLPSLSDDHFVSMFLDEARLAAHITSPNVVQTFELGRADDDGALYIVMELVVGVTLFELCVNVVERGPGKMPIDVVVEIIAQAARGLDDAHNATTPTGQSLKVIHRDVSPQNILVGADGRVRMTDFGIARAVSRSTQTQAGQLKGKVAYLSPEQSRAGPLDRRSDVFALGVVAWEALTGRSLFNTGDPISTMKRVKELKIPSPRALRRDVPEEVAKVVLWALERDPTRRCPDAARFGRALRDAHPDHADSRTLAGFVSRHGGASLRRIYQRINEVERGGETTVMRPKPAAPGSATGRIIPDAEPEEPKVLGSSRPEPKPDASEVEVPPAPKTPAPEKPQRDVSTALIKKKAILPFLGSDDGGESPDTRKWAMVGLGVLAWIGAGVLAWVLLSGDDRGRRRPLSPDTQTEASE